MAQPPERNTYWNAHRLTETTERIVKELTQLRDDTNQRLTADNQRLRKLAAWLSTLDEARDELREALRHPNKSTLTPVADPNGNLLWLHRLCGNTQWGDGQQPPDHCRTCADDTDAWHQLHVDPSVQITRSRPQAKPRRYDLAKAFSKAFSEAELSALLSALETRSDSCDNTEVWTRLELAVRGALQLPPRRDEVAAQRFIDSLTQSGRSAEIPGFLLFNDANPNGLWSDLSPLKRAEWVRRANRARRRPPPADGS